MSVSNPEKVIIALLDRENGFQSDAELPCHMLVSDLSVGLLRLLQAKEPGRYAGCTRIDLWVGDRKLSGNQTLASVGAWEGTLLLLRPQRAGF